jgi:hypothetical protein
MDRAAVVAKAVLAIASRLWTGSESEAEAEVAAALRDEFADIQRTTATEIRLADD